MTDTIKTETSLAPETLAEISDQLSEIQPNFDLLKPYPTLTAKEIENLPPARWLVKDLIQKDTLNVLYGPPEVGKSFFMVALLTAIANGIDIGPLATYAESKRSWVLYLSYEGLNGLGQRFKAHRLHNKIEEIKNFETQILPVNFLDDDAGGDIAKLCKTIFELVQKYNCMPSLIVIDTLACAIAGEDENQVSVITALSQNLHVLQNIFKTTFLIIHHTNKKGEIRGSTAILANFNCAMLMLENQNGNVFIRHEKIKDGPKRQFFMDRSLIKWTDEKYGEISSLSYTLSMDEPVSTQQRVKAILEGSNKLNYEKWEKLAQEHEEIPEFAFKLIVEKLEEKKQILCKNGIYEIKSG